MKAYSRIKLKHALLKKDLFVIIGTIAGYHYSDSSKATHVYTTAGIFPCEETAEQISEQIDRATAPTAHTSVGAAQKETA
jgi:hypothetical protein